MELLTIYEIDRNNQNHEINGDIAWVLEWVDPSCGIILL